jgi:hypothetical protein
LEGKIVHEGADYQVVFDVCRAGYRHWWFPAVGIALGALWYAIDQVTSRITKGPLSPRWTFPARWGYPFFAVLTGIALLWSGGDYLHLCWSLRQGHFILVEGTVEHFVPMRYEGHGLESFEVAGHHYEYSDFMLTAGFNNTRSHGGPIHQGVKVRIADVAGSIARLEIGNARGPAVQPRDAADETR